MKLVYLHGLMQDASAWNAVREILDGEMPGDSMELYALTEDMTFAGLYAALEAYLLRETEPVHLVGLSLGGMLAMRYAALHPDKVGALTLIGVQTEVPAMLVGLQNLLFRLMPEKAFAEGNLTRAQTISLCESMRRLNLRGEAMNLRCPVQMVCGKKDRANRRAAEEIAALIRTSGGSCRTWTITGAGHEVNADAPEKLAAAIRSL